VNKRYAKAEQGFDPPQADRGDARTRLRQAQPERVVIERLVIERLVIERVVIERVAAERVAVYEKSGDARARLRQRRTEIG